MSETKKEIAKYVSKYAKLEIILKSAQTREVNGRIIVEHGVHVKFNNGYFETEDMELAKELESRKDFNVVFYRVPEGKTVESVKDEFMKTIEEKDAEIAKLKEEIAKKSTATRVKAGTTANSNKPKDNKNKGDKEPKF